MLSYYDNGQQERSPRIPLAATLYRSASLTGGRGERYGYQGWEGTLDLKWTSHRQDFTPDSLHVFESSGGPDRTRICDLYRVKVAL